MTTITKTDILHQHSYRRLFRIVTRNMDNWKMPITVAGSTDEMRGGDEVEQMRYLVRRMNRINDAVRFMVGGESDWRVYENADGEGRTLVLRNAGYYRNIGA